MSMAVKNAGGIFFCIKRGSKNEMEQDELWKLIESMPVFDNHCHPTLKAAHPTVPLLSVFTEGPMELTIGSMRNVRILADVFNAPSADSIVSRSGMNPADFLRRGGYIGCIVDDGFVSPHGESFEWDGMSANGNVWRVARVESIMERCLAESRSDVTFPLFLEGFRARVSAELHSRGCVGLKTICAYRCGLDLSVTGTEADMMEAVETAFRSLQGREKIRIENKTLISFLLQESVKLLSKNQVLQIHSGFGDNDLTLHKSDPSLMTPFIRANPNVPMVFLHAGYPFCRSTGEYCFRRFFFSFSNPLSLFFSR